MITQALPSAPDYRAALGDPTATITRTTGATHGRVDVWAPVCGTRVRIATEQRLGTGLLVTVYATHEWLGWTDPATPACLEEQ